MIKLYKDQKLEIIQELKKLHEKSVNYVESLKERADNEEWISFYCDINEYESVNIQVKKLIEELDNDIENLSEAQWNGLLAFIIMNDMDGGNEIDCTNLGWSGIMWLMVAMNFFNNKNGKTYNIEPNSDDIN